MDTVAALQPLTGGDVEGCILDFLLSAYGAASAHTNIKHK